MSLQLWLVYVSTVAILLVVPGPTVLLVVGHSFAHGWRLATRSVLGVISGDFVAMTVSMAGLGAVLAASSQLFTLLKWLGALYLIYLGIRQWCSRADQEVASCPSQAPAGSLYAQAFLVTALNPKGIVFFVAFFPQFLDRNAPALPQIVFLGITFLVMAATNASLYVLLADRLRTGLKSARRRRLFNCLGGTALIGAGILTVALGRR